jgi:hypothetical protein
MAEPCCCIFTPFRETEVNGAVIIVFIPSRSRGLDTPDGKAPFALPRNGRKRHAICPKPRDRFVETVMPDRPTGAVWIQRKHDGATGGDAFEHGRTTRTARGLELRGPDKHGWCSSIPSHCLQYFLRSMSGARIWRQSASCANTCSAPLFSFSLGVCGVVVARTLLLAGEYSRPFGANAGELAEEADEAGWEPPRGRGAAISNARLSRLKVRTRGDASLGPYRSGSSRLLHDRAAFQNVHKRNKAQAHLPTIG